MVSGWRELSDQDLFELDQKVNRRLQLLSSQGVQFQGIDIHYLTVLLEEQMSERSVASAREKHLIWLDERLDEADQKIREAKLTAPLQGPMPAPNGNRQQRRHPS